MQQGVPTTVFALVIEFSRTFDIPKSPSFIVPFEVRNIFQVFISRCNIFLSWMYIKAIVVYRNQFKMSDSEKWVSAIINQHFILFYFINILIVICSFFLHLLFLFIWKAISPSSQYSITIIKTSFSQKLSIYYTIY